MTIASLTRTLGLALTVAALGLVSCGGHASPPGHVTSQSGTPSAGAPPQVPVPANATTAQIDACMAQARADGAGTWVVFPAGTFAYTGTLVVPDYVNLTGQGIWDQGAADGGGGTWLQCAIKWGSYSTIANLLLGLNAPGKTCTFDPCAKDDAACGTYTQAHGSTGCTFSFVRFKGGADTGANLFYTANSSSGWSTATNPLKKHFLIDTTFSDCEFERPQALNSVGVGGQFSHGNPGSILALWYDFRKGGAQISGNSWIRCHFGVKNGYHTGIDGYGVGTTVIAQGSPSGSSVTQADLGWNKGTGGSGATTANWNPNFDWGQVDHCPRNNTFTDCLFEYATWYPMDLVDCSRAYSMWHGVKQWLADGHTGVSPADGNKTAGWGNPPGAQWVNMPDGVWIKGWNMTRCYEKGSYSAAHAGVVGEISKSSTMTDCYCGSGAIFNQAGKYGNVVTGAFPGGHPNSPIFTVDWSGATTSYTPSPYDP